MHRATKPVVEMLEERRLLSGSYTEAGTILGLAAGDNTGWALAVNAAGDRMLVGAPGANGGGGAAYLVDTTTKTNAVVGTFSETPSAFGLDRYGQAVAFVGQSVVIGAPSYSSGAGAVYVYSPDGLGGWTLTNTLNGADYNTVADGLFGFSLAAFGTDHVLIGATQANRGAATGDGQVFLVELTAASGEQDDVVQSGINSLATDEFGVSVAANGNQVLVGARQFGDVDHFAKGAVFLYSATLVESEVGSDWKLVGGTTIEDPRNTGGDLFGTCVTFAGSSPVVGAPGDGVAGAPGGNVYILNEDGSVDQMLSKASPAYGELFGQRLAISGDTLVVGAPQAIGQITVVDDSDPENPVTITYDVPVGAAYVYSVSTGSLQQEVMNPTLPDFSDMVADTFGDAVALAGTKLYVGDPNDNPVVVEGDAGLVDAGTVFVFTSAPLPDVPSAELVAGTLRVSGTTGANSIDIAPGTGGGVTVLIDGVGFGVFQPTAGIVVSGGDGDDTLHIAGSIGVSVTLIGGPGNDSLKGGGGDDVIIGGDGIDLLVGGSGRDVLIGGNGVDRLVGNSDDDVLIAGPTMYDDNLAALRAILAEWSSGHTYTERVNNLRGESAPSINPGFADRLNGDVFLKVGPTDEEATVYDDAAMDILTGSSGTDWFIFNNDAAIKDKVTDLGASEFADDLDFINQA